MFDSDDDESIEDRPAYEGPNLTEFQRNQNLILSGQLNDERDFARHVARILEEDPNIFVWDDVWDEGPFQDFEEVMEIEVVNDMWTGIPQCCAQMAEVFVGGEEPLFPGSRHEGKDLARFILALKCKHYKMGDNAIAAVVGMMASFLPEGLFEICLHLIAPVYCFHMHRSAPQQFCTVMHHN